MEDCGKQTALPASNQDQQGRVQRGSDMCRWVPALRLSEPWLPLYFSPEFDDWDAAASDRSRKWVRLAELLSVASGVQSSVNSNELIWVFGLNRGFIEACRIADDGALPDWAQYQPLPDRALLLHFNPQFGLQVETWEPELYTGPGAAAPSIIVLEGRQDIELAWVAHELRANPLVRAQWRRACLTSGQFSGQPSGSTLLEAVKVEVAPLALRQSITNRLRIAELANRSLRDAMASAEKQASSLELLITGATVAERLEQFEEYLLSEPWLEPAHIFILEPAGRGASLVIRGRSRYPILSIAADAAVLIEPEGTDDEWLSWLSQESREWRVFNSVVSEAAVPHALLQYIARVVGVSVPLPPFAVWRQLHRSFWDAQNGIQPADWDSVAQVLMPQKMAGLSPAVHVEPKVINDVRLQYRPLLALRALSDDRLVRVYLVQGPDQTEDPLRTLTFIERVGRTLADSLNRSLHFRADVARRESLRRISYVRHLLSGPLANARHILADLDRFIQLNPTVANRLVPDDSTARSRALLPRAQLEGSELKSRVRLLSEAIDEIGSVNDALFRLTRVTLGSQKRDEVDVQGLLRDATAAYKEQYPSVRFVCDAPEPAVILGDRDALRIEGLNEIVRNAVRELDSRCVTAASIVIRLVVEEDRVDVHISDNALPACEQLIDGPFDEGTSTYRADGRGSGFGLAIVRALFERHGGSCELVYNTDESGRRVDGVTFHGYLPLAEVRGDTDAR
jgi:signal transduction histidine kinase